MIDLGFASSIAIVTRSTVVIRNTACRTARIKAIAEITGTIRIGH